MLQERDVRIIEFAKQFGITIKQCYKMFFQHASYGMDLARKRLNILEKQGHLLKGKSWDTNKTVYYIGRVPSTHKVLLADFYSELIFSGADIREFIREYKTENLRADGFVRYIFNGYEVLQFIEVVLTHKVDLGKYEELKDTNVIQKKYGIFPSVVVIDQNFRAESRKLKLINLDHQLNNFRELVLP